MGHLQRTWQLSLAALLVSSGAARADAPVRLQELASQTRPEVSLYYSRALAPERYSDFRHSTGVQAGLGVLLTPSLTISAGLSLDRELGAPIERFRFSNTTLSATQSFELQKVGKLLPGLFLKLPTSGEDREYLSYRGSVGTGAGLSNERLLVVGQAHSFGASVSLRGARNFFEYTTSAEGALANRLWTLGGSASLLYTLYDTLSFNLSFRNNLNWTEEGRQDDRYELSGAVQYRAPYDLRLSLMTVTSDRTFQRDQVTWNVNLYKPESTLLVFTLTYAPTFGASPSSP